MTLPSAPTTVDYRPAASLTLPSDHLHFGLGNDPGDLTWMTSSGVPWKYRYTYLAAGVNTGNGWETWNTPAGQYATYYMNDSNANGYIPVFSYYELLQSNPSTGSTEGDRDYSNLNNASTMLAYYQNWTLLMQKAAAFGMQVVVHVEPDLFGYMEQKAAGGDASTISASVASSGYGSPLSSLPNTFQGFCWALIKLRDTIAPNVVLALHASTWASGMDIAINTDPTYNLAADADRVAAFLASAGLGANPYTTGTFDVVFNDVADHDAGSSGNWWDRNDQALPDFRQWLTWMTELHAKTGRQLVVWQVPVGNQYFRTDNNTAGHFQDNRAEYFIAHYSSLQAAGIVAVMFGKANGGQTTYTDYGTTGNGDGITNPAAVVSFQCNQCNNHVSQWADDDGGYLRIFVGQYYQSINHPPCVSGSLTADKASPQAFGSAVNFTTAPGGCAGTPEYSYWLYGRINGRLQWSNVQPYSSSASYGLGYSGLAPGTYTVDVWIRNQGSPEQYDTFALMPWVVGGCDYASTVNSSGTIYTTTAGGLGCSSPEYEVWMVGKGLPWTVEQPWSSSPSFDAGKVSGLAPGSYTVDVWVRQQGVSSDPSYYQSWGLASYITGGGCGTSKPSLGASPGSPAAWGSVSLTASGCGASAQYEYWLYPGTGGGWQVLRSWGSGGYSWNDVGLAGGTYSLVVWARQPGSSAPDYDSYALSSYTVNGGCTTASVSADKSNPQAASTTITFTAASTGCSSPDYSYYVLPPGGSWQNPQPYSSTASYAWTPTAPGTYAVIVWARQHNGPTPAGAYETYAALSFTVT